MLFNLCISIFKHLKSVFKYLFPDHHSPKEKCHRYTVNLFACCMIIRVLYVKIVRALDFPGGLVVKNLSSSAGDTGSIPDWGTKKSHKSDPNRRSSPTF